MSSAITTGQAIAEKMEIVRRTANDRRNLFMKRLMEHVSGGRISSAQRLRYHIPCSSMLFDLCHNPQYQLPVTY